jgi:hypothetical protein
MTYKQALARALKLGYRGKYAEMVARDTIGMTELSIAERTAGYAERARDEKRRAAYGRAAERETDPRRAAHYAAVATGAIQRAESAIARATT